MKTNAARILKVYQLTLNTIVYKKKQHSKNKKKLIEKEEQVECLHVTCTVEITGVKRQQTR